MLSTGLIVFALFFVMTVQISNCGFIRGGTDEGNSFDGFGGGHGFENGIIGGGSHNSGLAIVVPVEGLKVIGGKGDFGWNIGGGSNIGNGGWNNGGGGWNNGGGGWNNGGGGWNIGGGLGGFRNKGGIQNLSGFSNGKGGFGGFGSFDGGNGHFKGNGGGFGNFGGKGGHDSGFQIRPGFGNNKGSAWR